MSGPSNDYAGPETFRADLLHQSALRLNRFRRGMIAAGVVVVMLFTLGLAQTWGYFFGDLPAIPAASELVRMGRLPGMTFVDRYGRTLAVRGARFGRPVRLAELPAYVPKAFLAAEDRHFYQHGAVDLRGAARAAWVNQRAGRVVQGGSTLAMQVTRELFLSRDRTLKRKVQEMVLAGRLERRLGKAGVLELFLNRAFFGQNAYGVEGAAQAWFGKPASALELHEAAFLAGLLTAPSANAHNTGRAVARQRLVLRSMVQEGWITAEQARAAEARPLNFHAREPEGDLGWALDMAAEQARAEVGDQSGDLVVRLTLDPNLQRQAAQALRETLAAAPASARAGQGAVVLLGPGGAVRAVVGGRSREDSAFNRAVQARRQPGSAFKPFVWAAALERGDDPLDYRSTDRLAFGPWRPDDPGAHGAATLTIEEALARSSNAVAVRLADEAGPERVALLARRFGLRGLPDRPGLSIALGAYEVSLLELTGAYQVFQQDGRFSRPHLVEEVARADGTVLYRRPPQPTPVIYDLGRTQAMTRMMQGVIDHGTGVKAGFGRPAAGKTGTSQDNRDAWFVGYTPDWAAGVWVGNDDGKPMHEVVGGGLPAEVWRRLMIAAHQGLPPRGFTPERATTPETAPADREAVVFEERAAFYATLADEFGRAEAEAAQ